MCPPFHSMSSIYALSFTNPSQTKGDEWLPIGQEERTHTHTHTLVLHESVHSLFVINEYSMTLLQTHIDPRSPCSALLMPNHLPRGSAVMRHTLSILPCHALSSLLTQHIWSLKRVLQPKRPHEWFDKTPPYETWECYGKGSAMFSHQMSSGGFKGDLFFSLPASCVYFWTLLQYLCTFHSTIIILLYLILTLSSSSVLRLQPSDWLLMHINSVAGDMWLKIRASRCRRPFLKSAIMNTNNRLKFTLLETHPSTPTSSLCWHCCLITWTAHRLQTSKHSG